MFDHNIILMKMWDAFIVNNIMDLGCDENMTKYQPQPYVFFSRIVFIGKKWKRFCFVFCCF